MKNIGGNQCSFDCELFSEAFLKKLRYLRWSLKKKSRETRASVAINSLPGGSGDFFGFHAYNYGDDLRYLDWRVYGRTDQLFVKDFAREGNFHSLVLIDASHSMKIGIPGKFNTALQIAAALAYLALQNACVVRLGLIKPGKIDYSHSFSRMNQFVEALHFLSWKKTTGRLRWHELDLLPKRLNCSLFLCSDFLAAAGGRQAIERLMRKGYHLFIFHILAKEETAPCIRGEISLQDIETGERQLCFFDEKAAKNYQKAVDNFKKRWHNFFQKYKITYTRGNCATPVHIFLRPIIESLGWI